MAGQDGSDLRDDGNYRNAYVSSTKLNRVEVVCEPVKLHTQVGHEYA